MPRLGFPRHRLDSDDDDRDTFVFVVKIVAAVLLAGVLVGFVLMATGLVGGKGEDDVAVTNPAVPTITDGGGPASTEAQPAPEPPRETVAAPAVGRQTAVLAPKAKPKPKPRPTATDRPIIIERLQQVGAKCSPEGAIAFAKRFEPLVCQHGRWQRMPFRRPG
jgi:hypothetical protein